MIKKIGCLLLAVVLIIGVMATADAEGMETPEPASPRASEPADGEEAYPDSGEESASPTPSEEASETPGSQTPSLLPDAEKRVRVTVSRTGGRIELDGAAVADSLTLSAGETATLKVFPDEGYRFAGASFGGAALEIAGTDGEAVLLSLCPEQDGELTVLFSRQHILKISVTGDAVVSYDAGDQQGEAAEGDALKFEEGTQIAFSVRTPQGSRLESVEFNGAAVEIERGAEGATFRLTASEPGTLSVRSSQSTEISAILSNCRLLLREGTEWIDVRDGNGALRVNSGVRKNLAVQPDSSCALKTLLVDGEPIAWSEGAGGLCTFSLITKPGSMVITAVCQMVRESVKGVDPKTGVHYRLPGTEASQDTNITEDSWISVEPVTSGPVFTQAQEAARSYGELLCAYELTLHNSEGRYEPTAPVAVSIPIPENYSGGRLKVLHESNGIVNEIPYRTEDIQGVPCVTIFTDSFSIYMLVGSPDDIAAPARTDTESSAGGSFFGLWIVAAAIAAGAAIACASRRRRNQAAH